MKAKTVEIVYELERAVERLKMASFDYGVACAKMSKNLIASRNEVAEEEGVITSLLKELKGSEEAKNE